MNNKDEYKRLLHILRGVTEAARDFQENEQPMTRELLITWVCEFGGCINTTPAEVEKVLCMVVQDFLPESERIPLRLHYQP